MRAGRWLYRPARECRWVGRRGRIGAHAYRGWSRTRHSTVAGQTSQPTLRRRPPQHSHRQVTHLSCPLLIINCLHHYHAIILFPRCCNVVCLPRQLMFSRCLVVSQLQCATAANLKGPGTGEEADFKISLVWELDIYMIKTFFSYQFADTILKDTNWFKTMKGSLVHFKKLKQNLPFVCMVRQSINLYESF